MSANRVIDDHSELENIGSKTHDQIDQHIDNTTFIVVSGSIPTSGRRLKAGNGVSIVDGGSGGELTIHASGSATAVPAAQIGQVLFSTDGSTFTARLPITHPDHGWLMQEDGILIVAG